MLIQYGFNKATSADRTPYILNLPLAYSNQDYLFIRVPAACYKGIATPYGFGVTKNSVSQVQFWTSNTSYYSGDNWLAVGC